MRNWTVRNFRSRLFYLGAGFRLRHRLLEEDRRRERGSMMNMMVGEEGEVGRRAHTDRRQWVGRRGIARDRLGEDLEEGGVEEVDVVDMGIGHGHIRDRGVGRRAEVLRDRRISDRFRGHLHRDGALGDAIVHRGEAGVDGVVVEVVEVEEARATVRMEVGVREIVVGAETADDRTSLLPRIVQHRNVTTPFAVRRCCIISIRPINRSSFSKPILFKPSSTETPHPSPPPPSPQTTH